MAPKRKALKSIDEMTRDEMLARLDQLRPESAAATGPDRARLEQLQRELVARLTGGARS
jgi:hypothetical protein